MKYKFRGLSLDDKKWVYGSLIENENVDFYQILIPDKENPMLVPIDYKTVGMSTGLKDSDGVEIFEGDIVYIEGNSGNFTYEVKFGQYTGTIINNSGVGFFTIGHQDGIFSFPLSIQKKESTKVVGNIHEKKEKVVISPSEFIKTFEELQSILKKIGDIDNNIEV